MSWGKPNGGKCLKASEREKGGRRRNGTEVPKGQPKGEKIRDQHGRRARIPHRTENSEKREYHWLIELWGEERKQQGDKI